MARKSASSSGSWPRRSRRLIFSKVPCKKSRLDAGATKALARGHLRPNPGSDVMQGNLSAERMCGLAMVSRAGFYRSFHEREPDLEEMELRSAIQAIVIEHKLRYGYRRVTAELRHRGFLANHKRVVRLMRLDNLLSLRRSAFVTTTDSDHELRSASESGQPNATQRHKSAVGGRYHVRPFAAGICIFGDCSRCLFSKGGRLGAGSIVSGAAGS